MKKKPTKKTAQEPKRPSINYTAETLYETMKNTGFIEDFTEEEFRELMNEPSFPIYDESVNLINVLAWLVSETRIGRGERIQ